ncbi:hypothetical protein DL240_07340 [Lujinxingia litoralis]|uniref:Uncharacterized protein n=1 Tax=Lujinxingia litoralis TaxID=2211119 RepID=A0A328CAD1_9DELT|nr:hypothetical protein [Lujinxingia litoralis]RAL23954.1 hypothetical protein DL240_07340 [Lujinxingia litoralis]
MFPNTPERSQVRAGRPAITGRPRTFLAILALPVLTSAGQLFTHWSIVFANTSPLGGVHLPNTPKLPVVYRAR